MKQPGSLRAILMMIAVTSLVQTSRGEDWYRWRGPDLNGQSRERDWLDQWPEQGPRIAWRQNIGTGFSSITVSDGLVYTSGNRENQDTIHCFDETSGEPVWSHTFASPLDDKFFEGGTTSTPTVDGPHLINLSRQGDLKCFNKSNGEIIWATNIAEEADIRVPGWGFSGSPLVQNNLLLLNVGEAGVAVDRESGAVVWKSGDSDAGYASILPMMWKDQSVGIVVSGKFIIAINLADGSEFWRFRWLTRFGANCADPIVDGDLIFVSSGYNRGSVVLRMRETEPEVVWKHKDFQNQLNSSVLIDGQLYGFDGDVGGTIALKSVRLADGETAWQQEGFGSGSLISADGKLIILSEDGQLVIARASPTAYHELTRAKILDGKCWTTPTLSNGRIFCRDAGGDLVCVDVRKDQPR